MSRLSISDVAREMRMKPSAIRYYEKLGLLPKAERESGRRRYDGTVLYRLAVIRRAQDAGFALDEIRVLFFGFQEGTRAEARWQRLADRKLVELATLADQISSMRNLLKRLKRKCHCKTLEVCGKTILEKGMHRIERSRLSVNSKFGGISGGRDQCSHQR